MSLKQNSNDILFDDEYEKFVELVTQPGGILKIINDYSLQIIAEMCIKFFSYVCRFARDAEIALTQVDSFVWLFTQHLSDPDEAELKKEIGTLLDIGKFNVNEEIKKEAPKAINREEYLELKLHALQHRTWHPDRSLVKGLKRQQYESLSAEEVQETRKGVDVIEEEYK